VLIRCHIQEDPDTIDRLIADGEASYNKWRHPDPYIGKRVTHLISLPTLFLGYNITSTTKYYYRECFPIS